MICNEERFQSLVSVIQGKGLVRSFKVENVKKSKTYQEYKIISYKTDEEQREKVAQELNEFLRKNNHDLIYQNEHVKEYTDKLEKANNQEVECGKIKCYLEDKIIKIEVNSIVENKEFSYTEEQYLTEFIDYLNNELSRKIMRELM